MIAFGALLRLHRQRIPGPPTRGNRFGPSRGCLSVNELAHRSGINQAYVSRLERGEVRTPSRDVVMALAHGLNLGASERSAFLRAAGYTTLKAAS